MDASSPEAKLGSIQGQVIASEVRSIHLPQCGQEGLPAQAALPPRQEASVSHEGSGWVAKVYCIYQK
jgi:hypothetical protein